MTAQILDGRKLAKKFLKEIKKEVRTLSKKPRLLVFLAGGDRASEVFVCAKKKACAEIGIDFVLEKIPLGNSTDDICQIITKKDREENPDGIVVQLPLPRGIDPDKVLACIPREKDVDSLSGDLVKSPLALAIIALLSEYKIGLKDRRVVVVGAGRLVGQPVSDLFRSLGARVRVCDFLTRDLKKETLDADILISGVGQAGLISAPMVKEGAVVVDAGTSFVRGKIKGDVDFASVKEKASLIAPVPGGVGPMTVAMLLINLLDLIKLQSK